MDRKEELSREIEFYSNKLDEIKTKLIATFRDLHVLHDLLNKKALTNAYVFAAQRNLERNDLEKTSEYLEKVKIGYENYIKFLEENNITI